MSIFMVIGKFGCKTFATAEYFVRHLTTLVPSVKMKSQVFTENDFEVVLSKMRTVLHCEHTGSPLIWRDLEQIGMCPTYIGGLSELFDFCKEYYEIVMPLSVSQQLVVEEEFLKEHIRDTLKTAKQKVNEKAKRICITGAGNPAASLLVFELIQDKLLYTDNYLEIRLHEDRQDLMPKLNPLIWDLEGVECPDLHKRSVIKYNNLYDAIKGCNLLIIMTEVERKHEDTYESWLENNYRLMKTLAENIDEVEILSLKTIVTCIQLLCFNTAVLLKYSKILNPQKTIAVTSHLGLEALQYSAHVSRLSLNDVFGPPVWGYIGVNQIVDTCHTKCLYRNWQIRKKPRRNRLKQHLQSHINFTDQPPITVEKRDLCFRTHTCELMWQWVNSYKVCVKNTLGCFPYMSQVNAAMHIINVWLSGDYSKEILSAGIQSNGSYGIPKGIVFSQPVILEDDKWKIYKTLPVPHYQISLRNLIPLPLIISKKFSLFKNLPSVEGFYVFNDYLHIFNACLTTVESVTLNDCHETCMLLKAITPPVTVEPKILNIVEQQKELRAKQAALLYNKTTGETDDENEEDENEEKRLEKKNKIIEQLKSLRKEMKEIVKTNPYNSYTKALQKMKPEGEHELTKAERDSKATPKPDVLPETREEEVDKIEDEKDRRIQDEIRILEQITDDELIMEISKLDLIKDLGVVYGNKLLSKFEKEIISEEKKAKPKQEFFKQYEVICEAKKDKAV